MSEGVDFCVGYVDEKSTCTIWSYIFRRWSVFLYLCVDFSIFLLFIIVKRGGLFNLEPRISSMGTGIPALRR